MMKIFGSTAKDVMLTKLDIRGVFLSKAIRHFSTAIICHDHKPPRKMRIKQEKNRQIEQKPTIPDDHDNSRPESFTINEEQQSQGGSVIRNVIICILAIFLNPIAVMAYTSVVQPESENPAPIPQSERKN